MTATPIPRTLAMSAYADLDFSVIDELPPGRQPIKTSVLSDQKRHGVIKKIKDLVIQGNQVYWVCTLIEESDALEAEAAKVISAELQLQMPAVSIGLVHGKLKAREKLDIMDRFKRKDINVLVATTVIEVGVDVPDATVMVIENAERLGLSQLHQLRGRVGRGSKPSYCILMYGKKLSHMSRQRMEIMRETNDGFKIAEKDLAIRGAGEILGTRQTGDIGFKIADLSADASLLPLAKQNAEEIIDNNPDLGQKIVNNWLPKGNEFSLA
jgi:ATP-dependent DNA helicase RecG